jgi:hypothetical protein
MPLSDTRSPEQVEEWLKLESELVYRETIRAGKSDKEAFKRAFIHYYRLKFTCEGGCYEAV